MHPPTCTEVPNTAKFTHEYRSGMQQSVGPGDCSGRSDAPDPDGPRLGVQAVGVRAPLASRDEKEGRVHGFDPFLSPAAAGVSGARGRHPEPEPERWWLSGSNLLSERTASLVPSYSALGFNNDVS